MIQVIESLSNAGMAALIGAAIVFVFLVSIITYAKRYQKVGPNEVMIISGRSHRLRNPDGSEEIVGYRIRAGGGAFIWPLLERVDVLSLEVMTLDIKTPEVYTKPGVPIQVDGVAQIKVRGDEQSIRTAAEQFLGKSPDDIQKIAQQTVEGHLRAIVGQLTVEDIYTNRDQFSAKVQEVAVADMANMGLQIVSFTLRDIRDQHGYLEALGRPRIAEIKRDAIIAQANADRDATMQSAGARQQAETARIEAETKIAESNRDYLMKKADYDAATNQKKAEADLAYDLQRFRTNQELKKEEVKVSVIEREQMIEVQQREIKRRELELEATIKKAADAERYRIEAEASAKQFQLEAEAKGRAQAARVEGEAKADVVRATGTAEAGIIAQKGEAQAKVVEATGVAEAAAMLKKAQSFQQYNQAAVLQMFIEMLPQIAQALAEPLSKTASITIVDTGGSGDGAGGGVSRFTGDMAAAMAQVPAVVKALAGVDLKDVIAKASGQQLGATEPASVPPGDKPPKLGARA
ncbi:MAG TPA: SPFH domain-containing protein [Thermoanaerobaculia bacterium]|nr:SPFH domain-containing protein [Thermoanaerobaculia bacterium]